MLTPLETLAIRFPDLDTTISLVKAHKAGNVQGDIITPVLFEETDGVYVNLQREKQDMAEIKVGIAYDGWKQTGKDRFALDEKVVVAGFSKAKEFQAYREAAIAEKYNTDEIEVRLMNADGAEWIKNLSDADTVFQLDPFHRNKAIRDYVPYKEAIQEIHELLDEKDIAGLFEYLETYKNSLSDDAEIEKAEKLITYFANNRQAYAVDYVSELLTMYKETTGLDETSFVSGRGHRKSIQQKQYEELHEYLERLKSYAYHIETCGEERNSYSKTDHDATFMRLKRDYMGNDQLLPAYNLQAAICDEYIAVIDVKPYASDMECFVPLMEKFNRTYGHYPKYPVADAGYGSYNNYLYCEEHGMEKYMKFTMYKKETTDKKYHENPYRAVNFAKDADGNLLCPNGRKFLFKRTQHVKYNKYGRTEELYECESCEGCQHKQECCPRAHKNRTIRMNQELTASHQEVLQNLESIHGALLRMNRSIQSEGTFGVLKWDKAYKRLLRRGEKNVILELTLISCGFNLYKYHNKKQRQTKVA